MSALNDLATIEPTQIWTDVIGRIVQGEKITMAVVELPPDGLVPEHRHPNEQLGLCLSGTVTFRVGDEERSLGPGGTWRIPADIPHEARAGSAGAVVVEVFSPIRDDWADLGKASNGTPRWPVTT